MTPYRTRESRPHSDYSPGYDSERERHYGDRGFVERAGDEVRSWFGNEEAERRRRRDEFEAERGYRQGGAWRSGFVSGDLRAGDVMTRNVTTVFPHDSIERTARLMRDCDCGSLPVVNNNGQIIGMITDRDITMRLVARGVDIRHAVVADCMTDKVFACHVNDRLESCERQMARHQIRRLPIVNDNDQIIGIISQGDLARYAEMYPGRGERRRFTETVSEISEPSGAPYR